LILKTGQGNKVETGEELQRERRMVNLIANLQRKVSGIIAKGTD
jgi:hypothetical protein